MKHSLKRQALALLLFLLFGGVSMGQDKSGTWDNLKVDTPAEYAEGTNNLPDILKKAVPTAGNSIVMRIKVKANGKVAQAEVLRGFSSKEDSTALVAAAMKLKKFTPAKQGGKAVPVWVTVNFSKNGSSASGRSSGIDDLRSNQTIGTGAPETDEEKVYSVVETMPSYPGGEQALLKDIAEKLELPAVCTEEEVWGVVIVRFVINKDGTVGDVEVMKSLHPDCDKTAKKVVKCLKKFTPGKMGDKPVKVWFTCPVRFAP